MGTRLKLSEEKVEVFALFFGVALIASFLSGTAFLLIQHKPTPGGVQLPIWLEAGFWLYALFVATQIQNNSLRAAIAFYVISKVITWVSAGNGGMTAWLVGKGLFLLAGSLMVFIGAKRVSRGVLITALFLLIGLSTLQYHAAFTWAKVLETIPRH